MSSGGDKILMIAGRHGIRTASIIGLQFNGSNFTNLGNLIWYADRDVLKVSKQKFSILISPDDSTVFTFTSGRAISENSIVAHDCRMDVFAMTDLTSPTYTKAETSM